MPSGEQERRSLTARRALKAGGEAVLVALFLLLAAVPLVDFVGRPLSGFHIKGGGTYTQQITFGLAFLGGLLATITRSHLTLSTAGLLAEGRSRRAAEFLASSAAAMVTAVLAYAAYGVVMAERASGAKLAIGLPQWVSETIMPLALGAMSAVYVARAPGWKGKLGALVLVGGAFALGLAPPSGPLVWLLVAVLLLATLFGSPVFAAMSGVALLLFWREATPVSAVTAEIYRLIASPTLPAIPLLTACGFVLAETKAAERLVRFFRALFGFMPGGVAILVAMVCALFTAFTGGSGVTIIALGGLVYPILRQDGYSESFSLGLVTAAGSLGLLFPPSLPVILYSVVANVPADKLFVAGLGPGLLLLALVVVYGITVGRKVQAVRQPFSAKEALAAAWGAKWELSIPVLMVVLFATGWASLLETSAAACLYTIFIATVIHRDLHPLRGLPQAIVKAGSMVGAVLILLACALGFTSYLVDAQVPDALLGSIQAHIESPVVFLLVLNVVLLVLGSVLEIFSAIVILTPLVVPLGTAYGIDPVHLGVIFLANLELGFLFPPVGLNLFLSSSRFEKPMVALYRYVVPFLVILAIGVLLITYLPSLSLVLLRLYHG